MNYSRSLKSRFRGAMLGAALGDALGAPFEGWPPLIDLSIESLNRSAEELRFTDDTHMMIGMAQSLVACRAFSGQQMAQTFAENFAAEPWRGYGSGPPQVFEALSQGVPWHRAAESLYGGEGSYGNGAAMRVVPAALFALPDASRVADLARQSAMITHTHPLAIDGAVTQACGVAAIVAGFRNEISHTEYLRWQLPSFVKCNEFRRAFTQIDHLLPTATAAQVVRHLGNSVEAVRSVPTALLSYLRSPDSFVEVVRFAISLGGDTDTIASMAGALCGARVGEEGLPARWLDSLERATEIRALADELYGIRHSAQLAKSGTLNSGPRNAQVTRGQESK